MRAAQEYSVKIGAQGTALEAANRVSVRRHAGSGTRNGIVKDYQAGMKAERIVAKYSLSRATVDRVLAGVTPPRKGGRPKILTSVEVSLVSEMRDDGDSFVHIAQHLGVAYHTVYKAYRRKIAESTTHHSKP